MSAIFTLNTGSSSVKFGLYRLEDEPVSLLTGEVERIGIDPQLIIRTNTSKTSHPITAADPSDAIENLIPEISEFTEQLDIVGVGHRIVHGGDQFDKPVVLTGDDLASLAKLSPLAPLHQPFNLAGVAAAQSAFPKAIQVGCFDTAFHRSHPWVNDTFALPREFYDEGVRRYGFHGLSYQYVTGQIADVFPELFKKKLVIAHLGNGASMCAVSGGLSIGSTMGFTALDGLPMGTRCGQIDPGVVLYLIEEKGMTPAEVMDLLGKKSGLLGLSGISSDMRELLASESADARKALDYYVFRACREIGALSAVLQGLDGLVFCGGIGENAAEIRRRICDPLGFLGVNVDADLNTQNATEIGIGPVDVLIIPTNEELVIARAVAHFV